MSEFLAPWFPFTKEEIRIAFRGMDMSEAEASAAAESFAIEIANIDIAEGGGIVEFGDFLGPVANISEDAARRVAEYRATWGAPHRPRTD